MSEYMPQLSFEVVNFEGTTLIRLEQPSGIGETAIVDLHPEQLLLVAERTGVLPKVEATAARQLARVISAAKNGTLADLSAVITEVEICK